MSCLFISVGRLVGKPHASVREDICNHMVRNLGTTHQAMTLEQWIRWQDGSPEPSAYIQRMRHPSTWGGAMELAVATKVYGTDIVVVNSVNKRVAEFKWREECTARCVLVLQWTGVHYEPVRVDHLHQQRR